ncbi:MAG: J domain-containing protein [Elusimicrobiota bacterium]|jgi:hypothetical protein
MANTTTVEAFPLYWPEGRPRTPSYRMQRSRFETGFGAALNFLREEVRRLNGRNLIISTNVPLRNDGLPRANVSVTDPGVAVYFDLKGKKVVMACDRWNRTHDNLYAFGKTIGALRGIERWGSGDMLEAAFRGFAALPAAVVAPRPWRLALGFNGFEGCAATLAAVELRYRELAREAHPDRGGSHERMSELNGAIAAARAEMGGQA